MLRVVDNGLPPLQDITTINILVQRNLNAPFFTQRVYNFVAFEYDAVGTNIGSRLEGDDADILVWLKSFFKNIYQFFKLLPLFMLKY